MAKQAKQLCTLTCASSSADGSACSSEQLVHLNPGHAIPSQSEKYQICWRDQSLHRQSRQAYLTNEWIIPLGTKKKRKKKSFFMPYFTAADFQEICKSSTGLWLDCVCWCADQLLRQGVKPDVSLRLSPCSPQEKAAVKLGLAGDFTVGRLEVQRVIVTMLVLWVLQQSQETWSLAAPSARVFQIQHLQKRTFRKPCEEVFSQRRLPPCFCLASLC